MRTGLIILIALSLQGCAALDNPALKCAAEKAFDWLAGYVCDCGEASEPSDELPEPLPEPDPCE